MRARLRDRGGAATHLRFHFEPFSCPPPSLRRKPWRGWKVSKDTGTDTGVYDIRNQDKGLGGGSLRPRGRGGG